MANGYRFLIKWKGWPAKYNIWESEKHFANAPAKMRNYLKKRKIYIKWDNKD